MLRWACLRVFSGSGTFLTFSTACHFASPHFTSLLENWMHRGKYPASSIRQDKGTAIGNVPKRKAGPAHSKSLWSPPSRTLWCLCYSELIIQVEKGTENIPSLPPFQRLVMQMWKEARAYP